MISNMDSLSFILYNQNPHWEKGLYKNLMQRAQLPRLIEHLALKEIQVLLGVRRSGKSTLFKLLINALIRKKINPNKILYVNLDDPFYADIWNDPKLLYQLIETSEKLTGVKPDFLFLDEIQQVKQWEQFIKSVYDNESFKKIFITASNSSLLKSQYATLLSGRYLTELVMPLRFHEILLDQGITTKLALQKHKINALKITETLLYYGGFPEVWKTKQNTLKRDQLLSYYDTIVIKDCIANHKVREIKKLQELALYLLNNNANLYSYNRLAKNIGSNENTTKEFLHIFESGFLLEEIKQFSYSLKCHERTLKKSYCVDNGLVHAVSLKFSENKGRLFENLVYNELRKAGFQQIYFYDGANACDFILKNETECIAIQVTFVLTKENQTREIKGLHEAMEKLQISKGYIITFDSEMASSAEHIKIIPFWRLFGSAKIVL